MKGVSETWATSCWIRMAHSQRLDSPKTSVQGSRLLQAGGYTAGSPWTEGTLRLEANARTKSSAWR